MVSPFWQMGFVSMESHQQTCEKYQRAMHWIIWKGRICSKSQEECALALCLLFLLWIPMLKASTFKMFSTANCCILYASYCFLKLKLVIISLIELLVYLCSFELFWCCEHAVYIVNEECKAVVSQNLLVEFHCY